MKGIYKWFYAVWWKKRWLLCGCAPRPYKHFWKKDSPCICYIYG